MGYGNISHRFDSLEEAARARERLDKRIEDYRNPDQAVVLWTRQQGRRVYLYYRGFSLDDWSKLMSIWRAACSAAPRLVV